jgi:exonuclease SbcD
MPFRFVHSADIHLDSPLRTLALKNPLLRDLIANATRAAFEGLVTLAIDESVDAVLLAGDLYVSTGAEKGPLIGAEKGPLCLCI